MQLNIRAPVRCEKNLYLGLFCFLIINCSLENKTRVLLPTTKVLNSVRSNTTNKVVELDVSSLVNGVYIIKVENGKDIIYKRFVKL